jgi:microcystin-dependent protein
MADPFTGEIRMFAGSFAPYQWGFCSGSFLTISEHAALFSLIGTFYGGDGRSNFALPDMRGRIPVGWGQGPGQPNYNIGQKAGLEQVTLTTAQMPAHAHTLQGSLANANSTDPVGNLPGKTTEGDFYSTAVNDPANPLEAFASGIVAGSGGNGAHDNLMPYRTLSFIISLMGIYPSRN